MKRWASVRIGLALLVACGLQARQPGDAIRPGFSLFSRQQEIELGRNYAGQIRQQKRVVRNPELQQYVERVGRRLIDTGDAGNYPYTFEVVEDRSVNAFALPGGPVFVNTGLIAAAENEAQLAGVIAHEISHVALRHGTNQATKSLLLQGTLAAGAIVTGNDWIARLGSLGLMPVMLGFSRSAESEADLLGTRMMARAGYDPRELAHFFENLEETQHSSAPQFLSSHPKPGNRRDAIEREARAFSGGRYGHVEGDFLSMQALAAGGTRVRGIGYNQFTDQQDRRRLRDENQDARVAVKRGFVSQPRDLWAASDSALREIGGDWTPLFSGRSVRQINGRYVAVTRLESAADSSRHASLYAWNTGSRTAYAFAFGPASHGLLEETLESELR
jgi:hypothetical protein